MGSNAGKSDSRSIDRCSQDLLDGLELLGECRLEIEGNLELGNSRTHMLPVLSGSDVSGRGTLHLAPENIRPEVDASDRFNGISSDVLNGCPVLGFDQSLVEQPLGDGLLAESGPLQEVRYAAGESGLAASNLNCPFEGGNVRFIHNHPRYTTTVVQVNNRRRSEVHKQGCIVLTMPATKRKTTTSAPIPAPKHKVIPRDANGRTLGDRMEIARIAKGMSLGREYTQKELLADASRIAGRGPSDKPLMTQQALSKIFKNKSFETVHIAALAFALAVPPLWLAYGMGPTSLIEEMLKKPAA